jgi:hypothetical protein
MRARRWLLVGAFVTMPAPAHSRQPIVVTLSARPHDAPARGPQDARSGPAGPTHVARAARALSSEKSCLSIACRAGGKCRTSNES